jgi:hypothetical protein
LRDEKKEGGVSHEAVLPGELFARLCAIDEAVAAEVRAGGCGHCGGALDHGDYPRKVRGLPAAQEEAWSRRISWCCRRCRLRTTPPSVRFLGRRVYAAPWVVVAAAYDAATRALGAPARTVRRWSAWWRTAFVATGLWRDVRGRLLPPVDDAALPGSLLARFAGPVVDQVVALLRLVAPLTTSPPRIARAIV